MNIVEYNEGEKIPYEVNGNKVTFNDELMINLARREVDDPIHIDISSDMYGSLIMGVGIDYVAQIDIPARQYTEETVENDNSEESGGTGQNSIVKTPVPFSMDNVTMTLYALR